MPSRPASRTVGLVATARPTFAVEPARAQLAAARDLLRELGAELIGPAEPLMTPDEMRQTLTELKQRAAAAEQRLRDAQDR